MANITRIYSDAHIWTNQDTPPAAVYTPQYPDEPAYVSLYHPRTNSSELVPFTDSSWDSVAISVPSDENNFLVSKSVSIFWDWNVPTYCRNQALALGFTSEDLTSPPPPVLGEEQYNALGGESGFTNVIELAVSRGRVVVSSGAIKFSQNITQTLTRPDPSISYNIFKAVEEISPGNVNAVVAMVKEEFTVDEGYTGYQGNLLDISTLSPTAWWDINDETTLTTRFVENDGITYLVGWEDKSGNGWDLIQADESKQPEFSIYDSVIPLNYAVWSGTPNSYYMQSPAGSFTLKEFYIVCYNNNDISTGQGLFNPADSSASWFTTSTSGTSIDSSSSVYLNGNNIDDRASDISVDLPVLSLLRVVLPVAVTVTDGVVLGTDRIFNTDTGWDGAIFELVAFSSELSTPDRELLETHLIEKWRINGDPGDYFYNSEVTVSLDVISANLVNYVWEVSPPSANIQAGLDVIDLGTFLDSDIRTSSPDWSSYPTVQTFASDYGFMYSDAVP